VATSCPFCITMISDGMKTKDMADKIQVKDIAELIDSSTN
jgi:Fe-S oxidoreductase